MHSNIEESLASKSTVQYFWSAKIKSDEWPPFGLWPNSFRVTIRHTLFNLLAEGCVLIRILIVHAYFLEFSHLYKWRLDLIIQETFWSLWEAHTFKLSNCSYLQIPSLIFVVEIKVFRFQRKLNRFLWTLKYPLKNKKCSMQEVDYPFLYVFLLWWCMFFIHNMIY